METGKASDKMRLKTTQKEKTKLYILMVSFENPFLSIIERKSWRIMKTTVTTFIDHCANSFASIDYPFLIPNVRIEVFRACEK